jgi:hypothetical protein
LRRIPSRHDVFHCWTVSKFLEATTGTVSRRRAGQHSIGSWSTNRTARMDRCVSLGAASHCENHHQIYFLLGYPELDQVVVPSCAGGRKRNGART